MMERVKDKAGFTLAELMMSVAIILILAAIAIPSIIIAQNNMRMVELNNAAQSIANAAQTQMTAMKVSGTWLAFAKSEDGLGVEASSYPEAINAPSDAGSDTYYITASDEGINKILPALSVDDAVRNGDYVIEFSLSTASVVSVFYADGKSGFFGNAPDGGAGAAQAYYASSGSRDDGARRAADPMIGYYVGTPEGATDAVALENPVIWVDDEGKLCVQDPNLTSKTSPDTSMDVTITLKGTDTAFKISGLSSGQSSYTVGVPDSGEVRTYFNSEDKKIYELTAAPTSGLLNAYSIDINTLASIIKTDAANSDLAEIFGKFQPGADIQIDAEVYTGGPVINGKAKAYAQWPAKVAMLRVYVTNPAIDADENGKVSTGHIGGTYTDPLTELVASDGTAAKPSIISMKSEEKIFSINSETPKLVEENVEAGRQAYSGGYVRLQDAYDTLANIKVTSGSYTANKTGVDTGSNMDTVTSSDQTHQYQIYEIWVNEQRVGYIKQGTWVWEGDLGKTFSEVISFEGSASDLTSFTIDTKALYEDIAFDDEGYSIYVRTSPRSTEVDSYFSGMDDKLGAYLTWSSSSQDEKAYGTTGSRGINRGAPVRKPFENEFGASSTVALWNMTTSYTGKSAFDTLNWNRFPWYSDLRIYYSATPAVAWGQNDLSQYTIYNALPSAILWLYDKEGSSYTKGPQAYVRDARSGTSANLKLVKSYDSGKVAADFEIEYSKDYLFYRVLEYCNEDGSKIDDLAPQYVPFTAQNDATYATIAQAPEKEGYRFVGWQVTGDSLWPKNDNTTIDVAAGSLVSDYDAVLGYGYVKLTAKYEELPNGAGLMYLEFDSTGENVGYEGYLGDGKTKLEGLLSNDSSIASWGYYVVVPTTGSDNEKPAFVGSGNSMASLSGNYQEVNIGGVTYRAYKLTSKGEGLKARHIEIKIKYNKVNTTFYTNFNFAGAVSNNAAEAEEWGRSEETAWNVRHADQFPGCLSTGYSVPVLKVYRDDCFKQSHDLDMAKRTGTAPNYRDTTFSGTYDGGGYKIENAHANAAGSVRSSLLNPRGASFLFPEVAGSDGKRASLKNIHIIEDPDELEDGTYVWKWKNDDSQTYVGLLAGTIRKCDVTGCTVAARDSSDEPKTVTIDIQHMGSGVAGWGILVGYASDSTITSIPETANSDEVNSKVEGISVIASATNADAWNGDISAGALVGRAESVTLEGCQVSNASVGTTVLSKAIVYAGGLVGSYEGPLSLKECSAQGVTLVVPVGQNDPNSTRKELHVGNFVGKEIVLDPDAKNSYEGVSVQQGDKKTSVDEFNAGTSQTKIEGLAGPGTEDARKEETESAVSETSAPEQGIEQEPERDAEQQLDQKPEQGAEQQPGDTDKTESAPALSLSGESAGETS